MAKQKYIELYKTMDKDRWYTAAELGVAPATMIWQNYVWKT